MNFIILRGKSGSWIIYFNTNRIRRLVICTESLRVQAKPVQKYMIIAH